jgi:cell division protein FtsB
MDDQFYRKENPKWRKQESRLTKIWKNKPLRWFFIFGLIFVIIGLFSNKGILQRIRLEKEKQAWEEKIDSVEKEQERLKKELNALDHDRNAVEKIAREKYDLAKEGETIYKLKKKEE